jgi:hypothetical protein
MEMLDYDGPVIFDCLVEKHENCFPMIPSGKPHNEMLLGEGMIADSPAVPWNVPTVIGLGCYPPPRPTTTFILSHW